MNDYILYTLIPCVFVGGLIGLIGDILNWPTIPIIVIAGVAGLFVSYFRDEIKNLFVPKD